MGAPGYQIGWKFPPTSGGAGDGFNDSGIAHFKGSPIASLARETIQNSLDASKGVKKPVHVSFELMDLGADAEFGRTELTRAIDACRRSPDCRDLADSELKVARQMLAKETVQCLRVSDRHTTGLRDDHWRALVKTRGLSIKSEEGAGGSHGIGKAAPFAVTPLRTVFYWTHYKKGRASVERFQGKSVLMSHKDKGEETQGTGFYGLKEGCHHLEDESIPRDFRLLKDGIPVEGTSLSILGFRADPGWQRRIAQSVIENYFYAIATSKLDVIVDPDDELEQRNLLEINPGSLDDWFTYLEEKGGTDGETGEGNEALVDAREYWRMSSDGSVTPVEKQDSDFGHCRLWIRVADGLRSRVGFVRGTGMLITTQQRNLIRFPGYRDFSALCVFEDPAGNELLRQMENPQHDQFEPERLPQDQQARGRRALKRITDWIRQEIRKCAGPPEATGKTVLSELVAYVPDLYPDDDFDDAVSNEERKGEPGFGERVAIKLKPIRLSVPPGLPDDDSAEDAEGDGDDDAGHAGGGGTEDDSGEGGDGGTGEGEGKGGTGGAGGTVQRKSVPVSGVRLLHISGYENRYRLSFVAEGGGGDVVRLELQEAGDSSSIPRDDVRAVTDEGEEMALDAVRLKEGGRTELTITADEPIGGRAWRLTAVEGGRE